MFKSFLIGMMFITIICYTGAKISGGLARKITKLSEDHGKKVDERIKQIRWCKRTGCGCKKKLAP